MAEQDDILMQAISRIPAGRWGVAISGGSDSVALLHLARARGGAELQIHAVHLDHETRQGQSTLDAAFVRELCQGLGISLTSARRSEIEPGLRDAPANLQARYRALRLALYARSIGEHGLLGILQAHHADDQAETVLMRLVRGTGIEGLCGIPAESSVDGVRIVRPLLGVHKEELQRYLRERQLTWREDQSNASPKYQRNQVRQILARHPALAPALLEVREHFAQLLAELEEITPPAGERLARREVLALHPVVQLHLLRKWALSAGASGEDLTLELLERVRTMLEDLAAGPSVCLPGGVEVRRRSGMLISQRSARPARAPGAEGSEDPS